MAPSKPVTYTVLTVLVLGAAYVLFSNRAQLATSSGPEGSAGAGVPESANLAQVQVIQPQRRDVVYTSTIPANISPWYQTTLYGKVSGYVRWLGFDKGDKVEKGQLLAEIEAPEIRDEYEQAEADYKIKRVTYERLSGVYQENPDVIAKQDVDVAKAAAEAAKHLRNSRRTMLDYTKVYAPFSGTITARFVDPGALIQAATKTASQAVPLYTIMDLDTVRVYVSVPQEDALLAKPGVPVVLHTKDLARKEYKGTITRTTGALDPATRTLLVEIDLPNPDHELQPGMFLTATLYLETHAGALTIPPAAIVPGTKQGKSVFVVENGKARKVPIKTGIDDGVWIEVVEGLTEHQDVVVVGKGALTDGQKVQASPYVLPHGQPERQKN